jgi:hypothetical protein
MKGYKKHTTGMNTLQRKIMRGIYYAYALRLISLPGIWQGFFMLGIVAALSRFVSPGNVFHNLLQVRVGELGNFLYESFLGTESWTLILGVLFVICFFSLRASFTPRSHTYSLAG